MKPSYDFNGVQIYQGDAMETLKQLPVGCVHTCVTSPPYYGLRDYGVEGQIGLEDSPTAYVARLVAVFAEVRRVLKDDGTLWLNIGDSYAGSGKGGNPEEGKQSTNKSSQSVGVLYGKVGETARQAAVTNVTRKSHEIGLKPKDLIGIPWMLAFALRADGWYLRCDIIWSKPNPMPESVTDRPTKAHEYLFLLSKSSSYYYDHAAIKDPPAPSTLLDKRGRVVDEEFFDDKISGKGRRHVGPRMTDKQRGHSRRHAGFNDRWDSMTHEEQAACGRNKRSVWTVATRPYAEAHFATFPPDLIRPCILAGCPENGTVLDPFGGSGTTALVAKQERRKAILIELNEEYICLAERRLQQGSLFGDDG